MLRYRTALTSLKKDFVTLCLRDQDCFKTERQWETLLSLLPGDRGTSLLPLWRIILMIETIGNLRAKWQVEELDSEEKWTDVMKAIGSLMKSDKLLGVRILSISESKLMNSDDSIEQPRMLFYNIPIQGSMLKYPNIVIIYLNPHSVYILELVRPLPPFVTGES